MSAVNRLAVVTGTSAGLGAAIATLLLERDWTVLGFARRAAAITHPHYRHVTLDLGDVEALQTVVPREAGRELREPGRPRVALVNNAATSGTLAQTDRLDASSMLRSFAVNAVAPTWLMGFVLRQVPASVPIRIVNVSSGAGVQAFPGLGEYGATKAALRMAGMVLGAELDSPLRLGGARPSVAISNYAPGVVDTDMQRGARERPADEFPWVGLFKDFLARGLIVTPEASAGPVVAFLESDPAERYRDERFTG
jgi:NAD(P)-dependent dehydrogenase (short-subunit alcohol dehydrogenase family)